MSILIKNAYILDMVSEEPNIEKKDVFINNNIIEKVMLIIKTSIKTSVTNASIN